MHSDEGIFQTLWLPTPDGTGRRGSLTTSRRAAGTGPAIRPQWGLGEGPPCWPGGPQQLISLFPSSLSLPTCYQGSPRAAHSPPTSQPLTPSLAEDRKNQGASPAQRHPPPSRGLRCTAVGSVVFPNPTRIFLQEASFFSSLKKPLPEASFGREGKADVSL